MEGEEKFPNSWSSGVPMPSPTWLLCGVIQMGQQLLSNNPKAVTES